MSRPYGLGHGRCVWLDPGYFSWWVLLVALPAMVIYGLGRLLGFW